MVSTKLVDGRSTPSSNGWSFYLVEVHHRKLAPVMGLDRFWKAFERLDTVPHIRSLGTVAVVGDTMVIGVGGTAAGTWQYDVRTRELSRAPLPDWLNTAWITPPPAFSTDGRFIAYLGAEQDTSRLMVRSWPQGRVVAQSAMIHPQQRNRERGGMIYWANPRGLQALVPVLDSGPSWASFAGHVSGSGFEVDRWQIYPDFEAIREQTARPAPPPPTQPDTTIRQRFDSAAHAVRSLPVSAFPELPAAFVRELMQVGCTIPQSGLAPRPYNVIHGTFAAAHQLDFAVICLRGDQTVIKFWWGGPARCPSELAPGKNLNFMEGDGDKIVFARSISTTDSYNVFTTDTSSTPRVVRLEHDAIVDTFSDKFATIWMCRGGRWISFESGE